MNSTVNLAPVYEWLGNVPPYTPCFEVSVEEQKLRYQTVSGLTDPHPID